jgi:hypothetical protein
MKNCLPGLISQTISVNKIKIARLINAEGKAALNVRARRTERVIRRPMIIFSRFLRKLSREAS